MARAARQSATAALAALGLALGMGVAGPGLETALAQAKPGGEARDGRTGVLNGIKAYEAGRMDSAVSQLSAAITAGGLTSTDMAKALYYRGLAYRKTGKTSLAISDLTTAIWLKDGLSEDERVKALEVRKGAYADAGLADPGPPAGMDGTASASASAPRPGGSGQLPGGGNTTTVTSSNPLANVGSFFSNIFSPGGGSAAPAPATAQPPVAAAAPAGASAPPAARPAPPLETASTTPPASVSAWSSVTDTRPASPARTAAAAAPPAASPPAAAAPKGSLTLQVAAVRSREEADRLAADLVRRHGGLIGARAPKIDEAVFGNMGTFYRVNVGPFASTRETDRVCSEIRGGGFDCLVVQQ